MISKVNSEIHSVTPFHKGYNFNLYSVSLYSYFQEITIVTLYMKEDV